MFYDSHQDTNLSSNYGDNIYSTSVIGNVDFVCLYAIYTWMLSGLEGYVKVVLEKVTAGQDIQNGMSSKPNVI